MAIDTAEKRRSAAGVPFYLFGPGVTPNAAKDVEWRQQSAWSYSGINPNPPVAVTFIKERMTLGSKLSFDISPDPILGGRGGW